jgi:signal transduction histidine kinase
LTGFKNDIKDVRIPIGKGITGRCAQLRTMLYVPDISKDSSYIKKYEPTRSELVIPLIAEKKLLGVFNFENRKVNGFSLEDIDLLKAFAVIVSISLENVILFDELRVKKKQYESLAKELRITNEELRNINSAKTNLISNISHELKTPLVSIKGYTDLLFDGKLGDLNEKQELSLLAVKRNAERLIKQVDNLIDISRLELGIQKTVERELINLPSVLDEAIDIAYPKAREKGIKVKREYENEYLIVEANREKLLRVFLNIIENALKFNKKNGEVIVKCYKVQGNIITEIKDTGIGIRKKYHKLIFDRFFQVQSSSKRGYRGSGIGLSLCLEIIRYFDGDIKVRSTGKNGSTFIIQLPEK